jgi:hypothetical protein
MPIRYAFSTSLGNKSIMTKLEYKAGGPRNKDGVNRETDDFSNEREGGDDALSNADPVDARSDEKVIVNEQRGDKTVNAPSQTAAHSSETESSDEEITDLD